MEIIASVLLVLGGIFGTIFTGILLYHYKKKSDCFTRLKKQSITQETDIKLIKKTLIVMAQMIDNQTNNAHSDAHLELEELAKQLLQDEK